MLLFPYLLSAMSWNLRCLMWLRAPRAMIFTYHGKLLINTSCDSRTHTVRWHGILRCLMRLGALPPCYVWFPCRCCDHRAGTSRCHDTVPNNCDDIRCFAPSFSWSCTKGRTFARVLTHTAVRTLCVWYRHNETFYFTKYWFFFVPQKVNT